MPGEALRDVHVSLMTAHYPLYGRAYLDKLFLDNVIHLDNAVKSGDTDVWHAGNWIPSPCATAVGYAILSKKNQSPGF